MFGAMPTLFRSGNTRLAMWPQDHEPPHFHILAPGYAAKVELEGLRVLEQAGRAPQGVRAVLEWARENPGALLEAWTRLSGTTR